MTNRKMFLNLAVGDLDASVEFFTKLGFAFDERFTDETATCMLVGEDAYVMLLTESKFDEFTKKGRVDATKEIEAMVALTGESRDEVDSFAERALEAGATEAGDPSDLGFMYTRSFYDLDGHHWEVFWMDPVAVEQGPAAATAT
jgi:uncharacterized protein